MWAANATSVSPSADCDDGRVHLTVANLVIHLHRALEPPQTMRLLEAVFPDRGATAIHPPLSPAAHFPDEGSAN